MLLIGLPNKQYEILQNKYKDKIDIVDINQFKKDEQQLKEYPINLIQYIKNSIRIFDITVVFEVRDFDLIMCLNKLSIPYTVVYSITDTVESISRFDKISVTPINSKIVLEDYEDLDNMLNETFSWIDVNDDIEENKNTLPQIVEKTDYTDKNKLTLQELLEHDVSITDSDIRDLKQTQNKLKVGMILQAKSMLNRVLKLSNILDKLYDEMLDRVDASIATTDTASLMYTTEYISKALSDTNQFIMSLINNEKIQNFFIVDNSSTVINMDNNVMPLEKRERIRRAAEIILNNYEKLEEGDYENIVNPNIESEVTDGGNTTT